MLTKPSSRIVNSKKLPKSRLKPTLVNVRAKRVRAKSQNQDSNNDRKPGHAPKAKLSKASSKARTQNQAVSKAHMEPEVKASPKPSSDSSYGS